MSFSQFLVWAVSENLRSFYGGSRWQGWQEEVRDISGGKSLSIYPFLWAEGPPVAERSKKAVPIEELWGMQMEMREQMTEA